MTNSRNVTKLSYELLQKHQVDNIIEVRFLLMTISLSFTTFVKLSIISIQILITFIAWAPYGKQRDVLGFTFARFRKRNIKQTKLGETEMCQRAGIHLCDCLCR